MALGRLAEIARQGQTPEAVPNITSTEDLLRFQTVARPGQWTDALRDAVANLNQMISFRRAQQQNSAKAE